MLRRGWHLRPAPGSRPHDIGLTPQGLAPPGPRQLHAPPPRARRAAGRRGRHRGSRARSACPLSACVRPCADAVEGSTRGWPSLSAHMHLWTRIMRNTLKAAVLFPTERFCAVRVYTPWPPAQADVVYSLCPLRLGRAYTATITPCNMQARCLSPGLCKSAPLTARRCGLSRRWSRASPTCSQPTGRRRGAWLPTRSAMCSWTAGARWGSCQSAWLR